MNATIKLKDEKVLFKSLTVGSVFALYSDVCMKIYIKLNSAGLYKEAAVSLKTGKIYDYFGLNCTVKPLDLTITM